MVVQKPVEIVVETRGGAVVEIYCRHPGARVILVDWDEYRDAARPGTVYPVASMSDLPSDTRKLVEAAE